MRADWSRAIVIVSFVNPATNTLGRERGVGRRPPPPGSRGSIVGNCTCRPGHWGGAHDVGIRLEGQRQRRGAELADRVTPQVRRDDHCGSAVWAAGEPTCHAVGGSPDMVEEEEPQRTIEIAQLLFSEIIEPQA